jgi:hypothetical protein
MAERAELMPLMPVEVLSNPLFWPCAVWLGWHDEDECLAQELGIDPKDQYAWYSRFTGAGTRPDVEGEIEDPQLAELQLPNQVVLAIGYHPGATTCNLGRVNEEVVAIGYAHGEGYPFGLRWCEAAELADRAKGLYATNRAVPLLLLLPFVSVSADDDQEAVARYITDAIVEMQILAPPAAARLATHWLEGVEPALWYQQDGGWYTREQYSLRCIERPFDYSRLPKEVVEYQDQSIRNAKRINDLLTLALS